MPIVTVAFAAALTHINGSIWQVIFCTWLPVASHKDTTDALLNGFGWVQLQPRPALYEANVIGGSLLGAGVALAGACPGTTLAQIGAGYRDALFTFIGGLCGAVTFAYLQPILATTPLVSGGSNITFADLMGIPYWAGALGLAVLLVIVLIFLEHWCPWREELGRNVDGDLGADC